MSLVPVDSLLTDFDVGPLTCKRSSAPVKNANFVFEAQATLDVVFSPISAHTAQGRELEMLPDADANREITKFYAVQRFFVADSGNGADVMVYNGRQWRIVRVLNYDTQGGVYIAWGSLVDTQDEV